MSETTTWTIAWRKPRANRFQRATNWSGNWHQAVHMAAAFGKTHAGLQVYYVPTLAHEEAHAVELAERVARGEIPQDFADDYLADDGNVLVDTGRRVRIVDNGVIEDELTAVAFCGNCFMGDMGDSLTGRKPCPDCVKGVIPTTTKEADVAEDKTVDLTELTRRIGLPDYEQSAVSAFTGDPYGTTWTEAEAAELVRVWRHCDADGVYREMAVAR